jgi:iron complex outermembrane receptor protein
MILSWLPELMNYSANRAFLLICLVLIPWLPDYSQLSDTLFPLEEVQIVTGRLGMAESRTGRHVTVIGSGRISSLPINSIDEILRYVPFMEVQSRAPFGAQADFLMRGSTFNQVLVLVDGMRINDPLTGHFNGNIPVPLAEISRIEVYRGPASAIYGPDAVGGVVRRLLNPRGIGRRALKGRWKPGTASTTFSGPIQG